MGLIRGLTVLVAMALTGCSEGGDDNHHPNPSDVDAGPTGELPFLASCETNEQCDTGLCFSFNAKGPHCTKSCSAPSECDAPSPGCNMKGVCKAPDL